MAKKSDNDNKDNIRINWGKDFSLLPKLDLLAVQKQSYQWFLEKGIKQVLNEISPIDDFTEKNWNLELKDYRLGKTSNTPEIALSKGVTFDAPLYVNTVLTNKKTGATYDQEVFLGDRDRDNYPIPEFIGAKSKDLPVLMQDWIELETKLTDNEINPILQAVIIAFSFV